MFGHILREGLHRLSLGPQATVHVAGKTNDDADNSAFSDPFQQDRHVCRELGALDRGQRRGQAPGWIGESDTYGLYADIKTEKRPRLLS